VSYDSTNQSSTKTINDSLQNFAADSAHLLNDSPALLTDSLFTKPVVKHPLTWKEDTLFRSIFTNPFLTGNEKPVMMISDERKPSSKDSLFYLLTGLTFFLAFLKLAFPKYFQNLFRLFLQSAFLQKHAKEVISQNNLPSLLFNLLFIFSGGLFVTLVALHYQLVRVPFWILLAYCCTGLAVIYIGKFLFIHFSGWVFNAKEAALTYTIIVFLVNKMLGIILIPILLLLAFSTGNIVNELITGCMVLLAILLVYRYLVSFNVIRSSIKVNPIHFFIYLCAVEVLPILIIYKLIFNTISLFNY
jgi:hypothetical protein